MLNLCAEIIAEEHGEFVEIAVGIDVAHFGDEGLLVDELAERYEAVIELSDGRNHVSIEVFFDEGDVSTDAEAASEHDVKCMR